MQTDVDAVAIVNATGVVDVKKNTTVMNARDFAYMSSPVSGESRQGVYAAFRKVIGLVPANFTPNPDVATQFPNAENFYSTDNTFLNQFNANEALTPGEGYYVFPSPSFGVIDQAYSMVYNANGVDGTTLNSGTINFPNTYNGTKNENYNLLGNP